MTIQAKRRNTRAVAFNFDSEGNNAVNTILSNKGNNQKRRSSRVKLDYVINENNDDPMESAESFSASSASSSY